MSGLLARPRPAPVPGTAVQRRPPPPTRWQRLTATSRRHLLPASCLLVLLGLAAVLQLVNLAGPRRTPAEAAVAARVQELLVRGQWPVPEVGLASWWPVAAWVTLTGADQRHDSTVVAGREAMVVPVLASVVLLWLLARAWRLPAWAAVVTVLAFLLPAPALQLHRTLTPVNPAVALLLAGLLLAVVPRRASPARRVRVLSAVVGAGCTATAVLVQPEAVVVVPLWGWLLWRRESALPRRHPVPAPVAVAAAVLGLLLLAAALGGRVGVATLVLPEPAAVVGSARVTLTAVLLPAAALVLGAALSWVWRRAGARGAGRRWLGRALLLTLAVALLGAGGRAWAGQLRQVYRGEQDAAQRQAQAWVEQQLDRDRRLLGDGALTPALEQARFPRRNLVQPGSSTAAPPTAWQQLDYVVLTAALREQVAGQPELSRALQQSTPTAVFGTGPERVEIRRVRPEGLAEAQRQEQQDQRAREVVGAELARNPAVELAPGVESLVLAGRVDARVLIGLSRVGALGTVEVAEVPSVPGEVDADVARHQVLLTRLGGRSLAQDGAGGDGTGQDGSAQDEAAVDRVAVRLAEQAPDYAPRSVRAVPGGLLVSWAVDAPAGLLDVGTGG